MAGAQAIGYNDPYFLQAYNSPNYLQMQQMQQMQQAQAQQVQQSYNTNPFASQNSVMQNITPKATEEPKKKNNTAAWAVLGTVALAGTAWMISRGKKTGAEGIFNQLKAGFKSLGKNANEQIFSFTEKRKILRKKILLILHELFLKYILVGITLPLKKSPAIGNGSRPS